MNNNESNSNEGYEWPIVVRNSSRHSNLDYYYGPYESYDDMEANVPSTVRDFGFTAAVHNADGSVTEYWLVGTSKSNLKWQQKYVQFNEAISVKGSVSSLEELEAKTDNKVGDMYLIKNEDGTYSEYIWVEDRDGNGHWELLGTETTMMKGTLSFKGVTPTTDDENTCEGYNGSQNVTVDMSGFASRSALSTATSGLSNLIESEITDVKKSVSCRNYALKTYAPMTLSHSNASNQGTDYYYKALKGNPACAIGAQITVSFDYEASISEGSFSILVDKIWNILLTITKTSTDATQTFSGHISKTITLSDTPRCDSQGLVFIQGNYNGSCTISNFKWELGDTETEWCPAPEDLVDHIEDDTRHVTDKVIKKNDDGSLTLPIVTYVGDSKIAKRSLLNPLVIFANFIIYNERYPLNYKRSSGWAHPGVGYTFNIQTDDTPDNLIGVPYYYLTVSVYYYKLGIGDMSYILSAHGTAAKNDGRKRGAYVASTQVKRVDRVISYNDMNESHDVWKIAIDTYDDNTFNYVGWLQMYVYLFITA